MSLTKVSFSMISGAFTNAVDVGADSSGVADSTAAFNAAFALGKPVYAPAGTYLLNFATLSTGAYLCGDGESTVLKPLTADTYAALNINSNSTNATIDNVVVRDLKLLGAVATAGFSEFRHLFRLNGGRNVLIENVIFEGFRGDGLYIGSGDTAGDERHNYNITVRKCVFNGVNNDNRNGISIIDGDGILIDDCVFKNCTRSNQPGAVDIEPDNAAFHVTKNITVQNCTFTNIQGVSACAYYAPNLVSDPVGIRFLNNSFNNCTQCDLGVVFLNTPARQDQGMGIEISGNIGSNGAKPFSISGVKGVLVQGNTFTNYTGFAGIGDFTISGYTNNSVMQITVANNTFDNCGTSAAGAISVAKASGIVISENYFTDCGNAAGGQLYFDTGSSERVDITGNTFDNPGVINIKAIWFFGHTFVPGDNVMSLNTFSGTSNQSAFPAYRTDYAGTTLNVFTPSTAPNQFPFGVSQTFLDSPSGGGLPGFYTQGIISVERLLFGLGVGSMIVEKFVPRDDLGTQVTTFYRYSNGADTGWNSWRTITAT